MKMADIHSASLVPRPFSRRGEVSVVEKDLGTIPIKFYDTYSGPHIFYACDLNETDLNILQVLTARLAIIKLLE